MSTDSLAPLRRLLAERGIAGEATAEGVDGEIASIRAAPGERARLTQMAPEIRALGYRYVALDIETQRGSEDIHDL